MARDSDALLIQKWAGSAGAGDVATPESIGLVRANGWTIAYSTPGGSDVPREVENQINREITALAVEMNTRGFLEWDTSLSYEDPAFVVGSDGEIYASVADSTGVDPTTDTGFASWQPLTRHMQSAIVSAIDAQLGSSDWQSGGGTFVQVNADWSETNSSDAAFIENKPGAVTQVNAQAGTSTTIYQWSPLRVRQSGDAAALARFTAAEKTQLSGAAPLASPTFTGTPSAPTPSSTDSSTRIATTAFARSVSSVPTGVITRFGGSSAPSGWLQCNGAVYAQSAYPDLFVALGSIAASTGLYVTDSEGGTGELWQVDTTTPSASTLVGAFPTSLSTPTGLAYHNSVLYAIDSANDQLWQVNADTPSSSSLIGALPSGLNSPGGMASHNSVLYAVDWLDRTLWSINVSSPSSSTLIGTLPSTLFRPNGLASFNSALYCVDINGDELWTIDTATPANSTLVGAFPAGLAEPYALAAHGGVLYATDNDGDELWQVNATTPSSSTLVGAFPAGLATPDGMVSVGSGSGNFAVPNIPNANSTIYIIKT